MLAEVKFTEARNDFSNLYNKVYNELNPVIVRRKQTEQVILLPIDLQKLLLEEYKLTPKKLSEDDGSITLALDEMEIYANADTIENAIALALRAGSPIYISEKVAQHTLSVEELIDEDNQQELRKVLGLKTPEDIKKSLH